MNYVTLDTTALVKGIFSPRRRKKDSIYGEQFRIYTIAKSIIKDVEDKNSIMNIPSAAIVEIAAVGARLTGKDEIGIQASDYVKAHGNIIDDADFLNEAVDMAVKTKISGFDNLFIACAKFTSSVLITDDRKMHEAAVKVGVKSKLLREMGD